MANPLYVPQAGQVIEFPDEFSNQDITNYVNQKYPAPSPAAPAPSQTPQYSDAGLGAVAAYGLASGYADIPGGIAGLFTSQDNLASDASDKAKALLQDKLGVDPTKSFTTAQWAAYMAGQLAGFAIPVGGEAKLAGVIGKGVEAAKAVEGASATLKAAQVAGDADKVVEANQALNAANQTLNASKTGLKTAETATIGLMGGSQQAMQARDTIQQQRAQGMEISPEQQLLTQRLNFIIGATAAFPAEHILAPLEHVLSKVPASAAPIVEKIVSNRVGQMATSGTALAAQQALQGIASDLVQSNVYNPDVKIGQDVLSQAAAGGITGVVTTGLIQALAHRRLAPVREAQAQIAKDSADTGALQNQSLINQGAETLRQTGVRGALDIVKQADPATGNESFHIQDSTGASVAHNFQNPDQAQAAIDLYKQNTGAQVSARFTPTDDPNVAAQALPQIEINAPPPPVIPGVGDASFKTEKGAVYAVHDDGSTTMLPASKKGDIAPEPKSSATFYAKPEDVNKLSSIQNPDLPGTPAIAKREDGTYGIKYIDGPAKDKFIKDTFVEASPTPEKGLVPVQLFDDGKTAHFGDPITDVFAARKPDIVPEEPQNLAQQAVSGEAAPTDVPQSIENAPQSNRYAAPLDYTPEYKARVAAVSDAVTSRLKDIGLGDVGARLKDTISNTGEGVSKGAAYVNPDGKAVMDLAHGIYDPKLTAEDMTQKVLDTLHHETIHSLRQLGVLKPAEFNMLKKAVEQTKVPGKKFTYLDYAKEVYTPEQVGKDVWESSYANNPDAIHEEAIAEMFRDWKRDPKSAPPPVRGLLNRVVEMFRRLFGGMKRARYQDLFQKIETGEVGARDRVPVEPSEPKFAISPKVDSEEFKKWFGGSSAVEPDGSPSVFYHGTSKDQDFKSFKDSQRGLWIAKSPEVASMYAEDNDSKGFRLDGHEVIPIHQSSRVIPLHAKMENTLDLSGKENYEHFKKANDLPSIDGKYGREQGHVTRLAKGLGFDSIEWGGGVYTVFDPRQLKSVFNKFKDGASIDKKFSISPGVSEAPTSAYLDSKRGDYFYTPSPKTRAERALHYFFGREIPYDKGGAMEYARYNINDSTISIKNLEKLANETKTGDASRFEANKSASVAWAKFNNALTHFASFLKMGGIDVTGVKPGDFSSAYMQISEHPESLAKVVELLHQGPADASGKPTSLFNAFGDYAAAKRSINIDADGKLTPFTKDPKYVQEALKLENVYPKMKEAYDMYQRVNKRILDAAHKAGLIDDAGHAKFTKFMDYYGFYRQLEDEDLSIPSSPNALASGFKVKALKGGEGGKLMQDPVEMMMLNSHFWIKGILKNIAMRKALETAAVMGEATQLKPWETRLPDHQPEILKAKVDGKDQRWVAKDPLFVRSMTYTQDADPGRFMKAMNLPASFLRESVTRNPVFMVTNMFRHSVQAWAANGENFIPIIDSMKGFYKALTHSSSYVALMGHGVIGNSELNARSPMQLAAQLRRNNTPHGVVQLTNPAGAMNVLKMVWDRLGDMSHASDAATRIAVYDGAIKQGASPEEAAARAREILDFSQRGAAASAGILTRLIPFLNGHFLGVGIIYDASKAAFKQVTRQKQGLRDANIGNKFLMRGGLILAATAALNALNEGDPDYDQLPGYVKDSNFLIPAKWMGIPGLTHFMVSKPFEAGIMWSTIPGHLFDEMLGKESTRKLAEVFTNEFSATFGFNPVPQALAPILAAKTNYNLYTGQPLLNASLENLAPELQYDKSTSAVARLLAQLPLDYNLQSGRFQQFSPIIMDNYINSYGGPVAMYITAVMSTMMAKADVGPKQLPTPWTEMPGVRQLFLDAKQKNPQSAADAYELFHMVEEVSRTESRLLAMGATEEYVNYLRQNKDLTAYKGYVTSVVSNLTMIKAQQRRLEQNATMSRDEKLAQLMALRDQELKILSMVPEINKKLGR